MFSDYSGDVVGFQSSWKYEKECKEDGTQTSVLTTKEVDTQSSVIKGAETQTDELITSNKIPQYDESRLCKFLNKVYPHLAKQLDKAHGKIFEGYGLSDSSNINISHLSCVKPTCVTDVKVNSLCWSCTGGTLAVSYGKLLHEGWCTHDGFVCLYNTRKLDMSVTEPTHTLEVQSCVTTVTYHPEEPSVLAAGLYSGEVVVWNFQRDDDPMLSSSKKLSTSHTDKVTCATWIKDIRPGKNRFILVTAGSDGKIFTWSIGLSSGSIEIVDKFLITLDYSGSKKYREQNNGNGLEIKCMSILSTSYEMVVGLDGGVILLCSLRSSQPAAHSIEFKDPVVRSFEKHNGIVTDVCCCPDNMTFASCGTDSEVRIYNLQQSEVLHTIHTKSPLLGVEWTNVPGVLATWGGGQVTYYHINTQNAIDGVTISQKDNENIVVLRMNKIRNGIVATGDQDGVVDLWMVPINESVTCGTAK